MPAAAPSPIPSGPAVQIHRVNRPDTRLYLTWPLCRQKVLAMWELSTQDIRGLALPPKSAAMRSPDIDSRFMSAYHICICHLGGVKGRPIAEKVEHRLTVIVSADVVAHRGATHSRRRI